MIDKNNWLEAVSVGTNQFNNWSKADRLITWLSNDSNLEFHNRLKDYIFMSVNRRIDKLNSQWQIDISWWSVSLNIDFVKSLSDTDIKVWDTISIQISINWERVNFKKVSVTFRGLDQNWLELEMNWIEIPSQIMNMKLSETFLGNEMLYYVNNSKFVAINMDKKVSEFFREWLIVRSVRNLRNIDWSFFAKPCVYFKDGEYIDPIYTDVLKECAKFWLKPWGWFEETIVLAELVKHWLWEDYLDFLARKGDESEWTPESRSLIRTKLKQIAEFLGIEFDYVLEDIPQSWYMLRTVSPYVNKWGNVRSFIVGESHSELVGNKFIYPSIAGPFTCMFLNSPNHLRNDYWISASV